ncbi:MAG: UDP-N-acetylmuramoyl-tripeptide--D-alanyl-D-alanine ligase [Lentimicrobium sp.]|jgi:UDP-N-acetylmuramoyl-tripeptide--D-alanyl-D-alanine ligase|nr:UDP-N-acetylmuramoyl-tripeptide--D-alanyl-D-alanine ligase [Lentimicrobium sp.]
MVQFTPDDLLYRHFKKHPYISTDSRKVMPGSIFFALKGDHFDGNQYAGKALEGGAAYAVIDHPEAYRNEFTLLVSNVLETLQTLATMHRNSLNIPVIAITGSNGKTTTKELMAAALGTRFSVLATSGNLNNHIGVPLTLLSIRPEHEMAVIEMGANHRGEIAHLCRIARPTHGLITNIGKAHLEGFGGIEGVVKAKNELYDHLRNNGGTVFVNADDPLLMKLSQNMHRITYGQNQHASYQGTLKTGTDQGLEINLNDDIQIHTRLMGSYNFPNVMAAIAIALHFRVEKAQATEALTEYEPRMNRSQLLHTTRNLLVLDAYNANPSSMEAALHHFATMTGDHKILLLGDMFELGASAAQEHDRILNLAMTLNVEQIYTAGPLFLQAAKMFPDVKAFGNTESLQKQLSSKRLTDKTILIKGSRGMKMEQLLDQL